MRITITADGGSPVTLCDHGREGPSGLCPVPIRRIDVNEFVQGLYAKPKNRGNTLNQLTFTVQKEHASYTDAQLYLFKLNETVPVYGVLSFELEDNYTTLQAQDATVEIAPQPIVGVATTVTYTLKYGALSATKLAKTLRDSAGMVILTNDGLTIKTVEDP